MFDDRLIPEEQEESDPYAGKFFFKNPISSDEVDRMYQEELVENYGICIL